METIRILSLGGGFESFDRLAWQRRPEEVERLQHASDIGRQRLPFHGNAQIEGGLTTNRHRQPQESQKKSHQPVHCFKADYFFRVRSTGSCA